MTINESIKQCRVSRNYTQEKLAEKLGISKRQLIFLEQGERKLTADVLIHMADILNCSLDELVGRNVRKEV